MASFRLRSTKSAIYLVDMDLPGGDSARAIGRTKDSAKQAMLALLEDLFERYPHDFESYSSPKDYFSGNASFTPFVLDSANIYGSDRLYMAGPQGNRGDSVQRIKNRCV